jgi:hypothetical protein
MGAPGQPLDQVSRFVSGAKHDMLCINILRHKALQIESGRSPLTALCITRIPPVWKRNSSRPAFAGVNWEHIRFLHYSPSLGCSIHIIVVVFDDCSCGGGFEESEYAIAM